MNQHPAVLIFKDPAVEPKGYQPVLWGLEEEGVPFEIRETAGGETVALAKQAAQGSRLDVGIAIGEGGEVILHHRDLPADTPLFVLENRHLKPGRLRRLGMNAARLVKRLPLALGNDASGAADIRHSSGTTLNDLEKMILGILDEMVTDPSFGIEDRSRSYLLSSETES
jgi:hypothetical protein